MADRLGRTSALGGAPERVPTHSPGPVGRDLAVVWPARGDALSDLGALWEQQPLFGPVASDSTAYRLIERIVADPWGRRSTSERYLWRLGRRRGGAARAAAAGGESISARRFCSRIPRS